MSEKFDKAKQRVLLDHRFFASMMMRMKWKEDPTCETAWTNGREVGYNPTFIEKLTTKQTMGTIIHELFHPMMKHHLRIGNKNHDIWNQSCDYAINPLIINCGFELPDGALIDERFYGMLAEQIYPILMQEKQDQNQQKNDQGDQNQSGQGNQQKNKQNDQKKKSQDEIRPGIDENGKPADEAELQKQENEINVAISQAAKFAEKAGQGFAGMERLVKNISTVETPWQQILSNFLYESAKTQYDWSRPSRRHEQYFPSLHNYEAGNIVIAIDSSGSINELVFDKFISELSSILSNISSEIWVIICDNKIQEAKQITVNELSEIKPRGFGGTSFKPVFKWLDENDITPTAMIYLTDLDCYRYPEEPTFPVLWATYGWHGKSTKIPFGEKILLN